MKTRLQLSLLFVILTFPVFINAQTVAEELGQFDGVIASGNIEMVLIADSKNFASISGKEKDIDNLEIEMKGSSISFKQKSSGLFNWFKNNGRVKIELHYTEKLEDIRTSASAYISSEEIIESDQLTVKSSSGSSVALEIACEELNVSVSSGADVDLSGYTNYQKVKVSSGGRYKSEKVNSKEAVAKVSSGGYIALWVDEKLEGRASSGGTISYSGNPSTTDVSSSSGGSIKNRKSRT